MRVRTLSMRGCVWGLVMAALGGCGGGRSQVPVATLSASPQAAAAFDLIREAWRDQDPIGLAPLKNTIEEFLRRFPSDGLAPMARIALAVLAMNTGDSSTADAEMDLTSELPAGTEHDFWLAAQARRLRLRGDAEGALNLTIPVAGKSVDPLVRSVIEEELTLDALATGRQYEAISYMDTWLRATPDQDRTHVRAHVGTLVNQLNTEVVVGALKTMQGGDRATYGYGADIQRVLLERLVAVAIDTGNAELARLLLDLDSSVVALAGDRGPILEDLATSHRGLNVVAGRTLGVLLPTNEPGLRDEAASVLRGVTWAFGLPEGIRSASSHQPDGATSPLATCAPLEPAPELGEPEASEQLHLVTLSEDGSESGIVRGLDELSGEGAVAVIAGLSVKEAAQALSWSDAHGVAVVTLARTNETPDNSRFGFSLGAFYPAVIGALLRAAPTLGVARVIPIVDPSAAIDVAGDAGVDVATPVPCDVSTERAGDFRFPIVDWQHGGDRAWLVDASPGCARDLYNELEKASMHGIVALTLQAAFVPPRASGLRVISARAGVVPEIASGDPRANELNRFTDAFGEADWWAALGRDAATLARVALRQMPTGPSSQSDEVTGRRTKARDELAAARARLWTTDAAGWDGHVMPRSVCTDSARSP
jgi:hypothetical protein